MRELILSSRRSMTALRGFERCIKSTLFNTLMLDLIKRTIKRIWPMIRVVFEVTMFGTVQAFLMRITVLMFCFFAILHTVFVGAVVSFVIGIEFKTFLALFYKDSFLPFDLLKIKK